MVDAFIQVVFDNINSLRQKEYFGLVWGVNQEMKRFSNSLLTVRDVLEDAEVKQFKDKAIRGWLKKLKDVAYEADDILDECEIKALQFEEAHMRNCSSLTCNQVTHSSFLSWFSFEQLMFRCKIGKRIKDIRKRFDDIADERSKFHLNPRGIVEQSTIEISSSERETSSILTKSQVYGRDDDREEIVKLLLNNSSNPNLLVYPIIGIGGLGKTTLAQQVYNDERMKDHFEARSWVCVSYDFNVKRLTRAIIESMGGTVGDRDGWYRMQRHLRLMLGGKRFLLVLDDVWEEDEDMWDRLKCQLPKRIEGCSILVTTRIEKVASIMGTYPAHQLKELSEDDRWALFKQHAFGLCREEQNVKFVEIGKEIMKKCGGVPLATKALGRLMRSKHTEVEWLFVRDSEIWDLPEDEENTILPALKLSYNHLPSHLRQCFAYCSIFPKDYMMEKEQLVHLWMANGFIPSKGTMELEDIGNDIFNELLWRSFFQEVEKDVEYGKGVVYYKMHDLVHDLACSIMVNECLALENGMEKIVPQGIRYFSSLELQSNAPTGSLSSLRTLLLKLPATHPPPKMKLSDLKCLRALHLSTPLLSYRHPSNIASSLASSIHLRYLNLSNMHRIRILPESLANLNHLQTLILRNCKRLKKLPAHMSNMSSLRHLDIVGCNRLSYMPSWIGRLIHLQTLSTFIVGKKSGCGINELQGLNNLRGQLHIKGLEKVKDSMKVKEANLIRKGNINSLTLSWSSSPNIENAEQVLEGLQPPASIQIFEIKSYKGMKFPSWMEDYLSLRNLVSVKLINCKRCENLPPLGHLPLLKFMEVRGMETVRYLDDESYGGDDHTGLGGKLFPSLQSLKLEHMQNLEELLLLNNNNINVPADDDHQGGIRRQVVFPCLVEMWISNCDKLRTLTPLVLPSLERLFFGTKNENVPQGFLQIRNLPVLQRLVIRDCTMLVTLPRLSTQLLGELDFIISSLSVLEIHCCDALKSLWEDETQLQFQCLSSLKSLKIASCTRLASLSGMRYLTALQHLHISRCPELQLSLMEDFRYLTSLQQLRIEDQRKLIYLPESLKHATTLQCLGIYSCDGLTALPEWIGNLTSLRALYISSCKNLTSLPDELLQLTALQTLEIDHCHVRLERRCKEGREDWHKISHIPNVTVISW